LLLSLILHSTKAALCDIPCKTSSVSALEATLFLKNVSQETNKPEVVPKKYLLAFILTTCCFSLWGFANDFTNPLVKVYEQVFIIGTSEASWLQFAFYTGYFCRL